MKKFIIFFIILSPFLSLSQAHLGSSLAQIKALHPKNTFEIDYTTNGIKYALTEMVLGTFIYYFDGETGLSNFCIQIPSNMTNLNTQVEIYNKKYVINSKTSWTAYLEGGGLMYIKLKYDGENKIYTFVYSSLEL